MTETDKELVRCAREHLADRRSRPASDPKTDLTDEEKAALDAMPQSELEFWVFLLEKAIKCFGPMDNSDENVKTRKVYHHILVRLGVINLVAVPVREETSSNSRKPSNKGLLGFIVSSATVNDDFEQRGRIHGT